MPGHLIRAGRAARDHVEVAHAIRAAATQAPKRLWIGDSHAIFFSGAPPRRFALSSEGEAVIWLGPRLMHSIARRGFPEPLIPQLRRARIDWGMTPIVVAHGEIDCRVHLVKRFRDPRDLDFIAGYVERAAELRMRLNGCHLFLLGPTPPSDKGSGDPSYPRQGTLAQRVAITRMVELRLCDAVGALGNPNLSAIPIGKLVADPDSGALEGKFTDDGCHVNALGAALIREELDAAFHAVLASGHGQTETN